MASEMFKSYESDFQMTYSEITHKLEEARDLDAASRKASLLAIDRAIDEAKEIIDQMSIEVQNIASSSRATFNARIRQFRGDLEKARKEYKSLAELANRRALLGDSIDDGAYSDDISLDQRQQLLSGQSAMDRTTDRLAQSQRIAYETESIGASILNDLHAQGEQLQNTHSTLLDANSYVDKSIRTLRGMARRMAANRIITIAIITILVILILLVIVSKFW